MLGELPGAVRVIILSCFLLGTDYELYGILAKEDGHNDSVWVEHFSVANSDTWDGRQLLFSSVFTPVVSGGSKNKCDVRGYIEPRRAV